MNAGGGDGGGGGGGGVYSSDATRGRCERHLLSKSVSHAILHDNRSQERLLHGSRKYLDREKIKSRQLMERTMKAFRARQLKKHGNWKREDEARLNCLNVPHAGPAAARPPGVLRLYTSPRYDDDDEASRIYVPLRPVVDVCRPQLQLLLSGEHRVLLSRLPSAVPIDEGQMLRYDRYRGKRYLERNVVDRDARLANLLACLGPSAAAPPALPPICGLGGGGGDGGGGSARARRLTLPPRPPLLPADAEMGSEAASFPSSRGFSSASREEMVHAASRTRTQTASSF